MPVSGLESCVTPFVVTAAPDRLRDVAGPERNSGSGPNTVSLGIFMAESTPSQRWGEAWHERRQFWEQVHGWRTT